MLTDAFLASPFCCHVKVFLLLLYFFSVLFLLRAVLHACLARTVSLGSIAALRHFLTHLRVEALQRVECAGFHLISFQPTDKVHKHEQHRALHPSFALTITSAAARLWPKFFCFHSKCASPTRLGISLCPKPHRCQNAPSSPLDSLLASVFVPSPASVLLALPLAPDFSLPLMIC